MSRLQTRFAELKQQNRAALVTFVTAGDPGYDASLAILKGLPEAGADVIELGMPFTDPMADGVAIQLATLRALAVGEAAQGCGGEELVDEADDENDIRLAAGNQCRKRALVESRQAVETVAVSMPVERFAQGRAEPVEGSGALFQAVEMDARVAEFLERLGDFKAERDAGDPVEDQEIQFLVGHVNASSAARIVPVRTKGRQCALPRQCRVSQGPTTRPGPQSGRQ